jgi:hypothetical protein
MRDEAAPTVGRKKTHFPVPSPRLALRDGERGSFIGDSIPGVALVRRLPRAILMSSLRDFSLARLRSRETNTFMRAAAVPVLFFRSPSAGRAGTLC